MKLNLYRKYLFFGYFYKFIKKGGNILEYIGSTSKVQNIGQTAWVGINKKLLILL